MENEDQKINTNEAPLQKDTPKDSRDGAALRPSHSAGQRDKGQKRFPSSAAQGEVQPAEGEPSDGRAGRGRGRRPRSEKRDGSGGKGEGDSEFIEKVLSIRRVTKVTKGGKKMSFSALVVVGDGKSHVGYAQEKSGEVATAIRKAMSAAKKRLVEIHLKGTTIPHEIVGTWGAARVLLKPAAEGTGVIASGPVRAVCDGAGIHNILTKCYRSNNPTNVVKATMSGLMNLKTFKKQ